MRILITNDDGIHATGLEVLERIARSLSEDVTILAPEQDQSGVAHSLSLSDPLRLRKISEKRYALRGTPTDCVIMGVRHIFRGRKPDLILSGVNHGQNVAEDITYSGTIAAAMEGTLLGVPSIALSQSYSPLKGRMRPSWETAERFAPDILKSLLAETFPPGVLYSVNFPDCEPRETRGIAVARQGARTADLLRIEGRFDGRGIPYYWIAFQRGPFAKPPGTDLEALDNRKIAVTPLRLDLTDDAEMTRLAYLAKDWPEEESAAHAPSV